MTRKNVLYLKEMGWDGCDIKTDIKNPRVRVIENIDITYKGERYKMLFEFTNGEHFYIRRTNKRTGAPLKKPVKEIILKDGLFIDTEYRRYNKRSDGYFDPCCYRQGELEKEFYLEHFDYSKESVLEVVNRYKIGEPFTDVCLIETTAREIIKTKGGYREKDILGEGKDFNTEGDSYFMIGTTWNDEHKIIRCNKRIWEPTGNGRQLTVVDHCDIDLITGQITG